MIRPLTLLIILLPAFGWSHRLESAELLIEPADLAAKLGDDRLVLLDVRSTRDFQTGHLPSAVRVDHGRWARWATTPDAFVNPKPWSQRIAALGIDNDKTVILYDADTGKQAARIWFLLQHWSVGDVRLLNGGFRAYRAEKLPIETRIVDPKPTNFLAVARQNMRATKTQLRQALPHHSLQILDVRSPAEFSGSRKLAKRGGHIPGAIHLEWSACLDASGKFKPTDELKTLFAKAGLKKDRPITTYCQSGGRASHTLFALKLAGYQNVQNYYSAWQEWGNDPSTPID